MGSLIYNSTGGAERGHSTSEDREDREATNGLTAFRQSGALAEVRTAGRDGRTWFEVAEARGWHHGQATGALSVLHRRGLIARLEDSRNGCGIYVLPEFVAGRATVKQGRRYDPVSLSRDVPVNVLREALRIAELPSPAEVRDHDGGWSSEPKTLW